MSKKDKWMEVSEVLSIFPTCIWKIQLRSGFRQRVNSKILQVIKQINPDLAEIPPGGSWQSGQDLHNREQLVDLLMMFSHYTERLSKPLWGSTVDAPPGE